MKYCSGMVYFVCEVCNETLKKNKVEVHASRCRAFWAVSCVDCNELFKGNSYTAHTSCVSEAQKYEGALYRDKSKKKQSPQERWMEVVSHVAAHTTDKSAKAHLLNKIAAYDNVPRKKAKFINFLRNSLALSDIVMAEKIFEIYEQQLEADKKIAEKATHPSVKNVEINGASNDATTSKTENCLIREINDGDAKKKSKGKSEQKAIPIPWLKLIRKVLKTSKDQQMEYKLLRQHVLDIVKGGYASALSQEQLKESFKAVMKSSKLRCRRIVQLQI